MGLVALEGKASPSDDIQTWSTDFGGFEKTTMFPGDNEETVMLEQFQVVGVAGNMRNTWYPQRDLRSYQSLSCLNGKIEITQLDRMDPNFEWFAPQLPQHSDLLISQSSHTLRSPKAKVV